MYVFLVRLQLKLGNFLCCLWYIVMSFVLSIIGDYFLGFVKPRKLAAACPVCHSSGYYVVGAQ